MLHILPETIKKHLRFVPRLIRNQFNTRLERDYYDNIWWRFLNLLLAPIRLLRGREKGQRQRQQVVIQKLSDYLAQYPKNIVLLNSYFPPNDFGGSTRVITEQVRHLKKAYGSDTGIWVVAAAPTRLRPYELEFEFVDDVDSAAVLLIGTALHPRPEWFYFDSRIETIFDDILSVTHPTLVHAHSVQRITTAPLVAAKKRAIPYIVTVHDAWWINDEQFRMGDDGCQIERVGTSNKAVRLYVDEEKALERLRFLKAVLDDAAVTLAVSQFQKDLYLENGFNSQVHENGIEFFAPKIERKPSTKIRFLYAGGLAQHKGYFLLKRAFSELKLSNWRGIIVDLANQKNNSEQWGSTAVKYRSSIKKEEWRSVYENIDVVVIPSIVDESFGLLAREALAAGCAVIVSDSGALAECVDEGVTGWLFENGNIDDLKSVLKSANEVLPLYLDPQELHLKSTVDNAHELMGIYARF